MDISLRKAQWLLRLFGWCKVPLIALHRPKLLKLTDKEVQIKLPLTWLSKNHIGSMYFGSIAVGADMAAGFLAFAKAKERNLKLNFVFKDIEGHFLKRPEADVVFYCQDGNVIDKMLNEALYTGERVNQAVLVSADCPSLSHKPVAEFKLTLSIKVSTH